MKCPQFVAEEVTLKESRGIAAQLVFTKGGRSVNSLMNRRHEAFFPDSRFSENKGGCICPRNHFQGLLQCSTFPTISLPPLLAASDNSIETCTIKYRAV